MNFWEILLIVVVALVIFGPQKLPELGKALGSGLREFKRATQAITDDVKQTVVTDVREANQVEAAKPAEAPKSVEAPKSPTDKPEA